MGSEMCIRDSDEGRFRSDLYYRLKVVTVHMDPLSKRRDDILPLADFFRKQANKKNAKEVKGFSQELRRWMLGYNWKGNVRQLKNVVESLVVMDLDNSLDMDDLSPDLLDTSTTSAGETGNSAMPGDNSELIGKSLKEIEKWVIEHTLKLANNNREETSRILGISERNLYRKLNEYELR